MPYRNTPQAKTLSEAQTSQIYVCPSGDSLLGNMDSGRAACMWKRQLQNPAGAPCCPSPSRQHVAEPSGKEIKALLMEEEKG